MSDRCEHGSPLANCADCLIDRLTRERDEARRRWDRLAAERDEADAWWREQRDGWRKALAEAEAERDILLALLREVRSYIPILDAPEDVVASVLTKIDAALDGRDG